MVSKTEKYMIIVAGITATIVALYFSYSYIAKRAVATYQQRYGFMQESMSNTWQPLSYEELANIRRLVESSQNPYIKMVRRP